MTAVEDRLVERLVELTRSARAEYRSLDARHETTPTALALAEAIIDAEDTLIDLGVELEWANPSTPPHPEVP